MRHKEAQVVDTGFEVVHEAGDRTPRQLDQLVLRRIGTGTARVG
jgi:hypothetical protein